MPSQITADAKPSTYSIEGRPQEQHFPGPVRAPFSPVASCGPPGLRTVFAAAAEGNMRGEVLYYGEAQGFGFINGADGNRYTFAREDLRREAPMSKGTVIEFQPSGGQARDVFSIRAQMTAPAIPAASGAAPAAPAAAASLGSAPQPRQQHFGRFAEGDPAQSTGLWSYFWRGITANYANFSGRARRKEYWGFALFAILAIVVLLCAGLAADGALGNLSGGGEFPAATIIVMGLYVLAIIVPSISIMVRRQHDIGLSGWFYLLIFIPYVGALILFVFALIPSQRHENRWGPVPPGIRL